MREAIINVSKRFEVTLTNAVGNFVTGETITYEVRNSLTNALVDSGSLSEVSGVYYFDYTFTTLGQFRILYTTPTTYPNDIETVDVITAPANADDVTNIISEIDANETKLDAIQAKTDNLPADPTSETNATSNKDEVIAEVDANEAKIDAIQSDVTQILSDIAGLNDLSIADIQTALDAQGYTIVRAALLDNLDAAISSRSSHDASDVRTEMDANSVDLNQILADIASLNDIDISDVQAALTAQGYTVVRADLLDNLDETVSSRASEANATANKDELIVEINANETKIDSLQSDIDIIKDKVYTIAGLVHDNTEIVDFVHDSNGNLISATVRAYDNPIDLAAQTNVIREYKLTATYNGSQLTTFFKLTRTI